MVSCKTVCGAFVLLMSAVAWGNCNDDLTVGPFLDDADEVYGQTAGSTVPFYTLVCVISPRNATVEARWLHEGEVIDPNNPSSRFHNRAFPEIGNIFNHELVGTLLHVLSVSYEDAGTYTCEARRLEPGSEWCSGNIEVELLVHLDALELTVLTYNDSQHVALECDTSGYIRPDSFLQWLINGEPIDPSSAKYSVRYRDGLGIAQNAEGTRVHSRVSSLVILEPELEDSDLYVCFIEGTDLMVNVNLTVLEVKAPAGPPQGLWSSALSSTEIQVGWSEVDFDRRNGNITQYEVRYSQSRFSEVPENQMIIVDAPNLEVNLIGLEATVQYFISVRAYTVVGEGPFTPMVNSTTFEDAPSSAPVNVTAESVSSTEIRVSWDPVPEIERNGEITLYEIQLISVTFPDDVIAVNVTLVSTSTSMQTTVPSLGKFEEYSISIRGYTEIGPGPFSSPVNERTQEAAPDAAPVGLAIVSFNASSLGVSWNPPPENTVKGILRHYLIQYCQLGGAPGGECKVTNVSEDTTSVVLTDLSEQQMYNVSVAAYTVSPGPYVSATAAPEDFLIDVLTPLVELGPENPTSTTTLSCSTTNGGTFVWQWRTLEAATPLPRAGDRHTVTTDPIDTQSSSLEIRNLARSDAGVYVCEVSHKNWENILVASEAASLQLNYGIEAIPLNLSKPEGTPSIQLSCDLYGFIPEDAKLRWFKDDQTTEIQSGGESEGGNGITIEEKEGNHEAQIGGVTAEPSVLSVLTIKDPVEEDSGMYYCGTSKNDSISIAVEIVKPPMVPLSSGGDGDSDNINLIIIAVVVVVVVALVAAFLVALVVGGFMLRRRKKRKSGHIAANEEFTTGRQESQNGGPTTVTEDVSVGESLPNSVPTANGNAASVTPGEPPLTDAEIAPEKSQLLQELTGELVTQNEASGPVPVAEGTAPDQPCSSSHEQTPEKPPMLLLSSPALPSPPTPAAHISDTGPEASLPTEDVANTPLASESGLLQQDEDVHTGPQHSSMPVQPTTGDEDDIPQANSSLPSYEAIVSPTGLPETDV